MLTKEEKQIILERRYTASFYAPWTDATLFQMIVENVAEPFRDANIKKVLGLEAGGFILGAPVAYLLHTGFVVAGIGILFDEMTVEKRKTFQRYHFHALIQILDT